MPTCHRGPVRPSPILRPLVLVVLLAMIAAACTTESAQLVPADSAATTSSPPTPDGPTTTLAPDQAPPTSPPSDPSDSDPDEPQAPDETDPGDLDPDEPQQGEVPPFEAEPPAPVPAEPEPEGLIAILGNDGDLLIIEPTGTQVAELTDHDDRRVAQPTWSPDAEFVAWTELPASGSPRPKLAIDTPEADSAASIDTPFPSFFNAWDPEASRIAMLGQTAQGVGVSFVGVEDGVLSADAAPADGGQPYFFDWVGPDSLYAHVGSEVGTLTLGEAGPGGAGASRDDTGTSSEVGGDFGAPDVLSDGTVLVVDSSSGSPVLQRRSLDGSTTTALANLTSSAFLVVDPTETFVAVQVTGELSAAPPTTVTAWRQPTGPDDPSDTPAQQSDLPTMGGGVWVYEFSSGEAFQVADELREGMFWDPTGTRLLMLAPDGELARWQIWSIDGASRFTNLLDLSPMLRNDYLPFYDQYGKNITFWSPDGSSFVYSALADDGFLTIFIHNASKNGVSTEVAKGPVAVWSPAGGGASGSESRL